MRSPSLATSRLTLKARDPIDGTIILLQQNRANTRSVKLDTDGIAAGNDGRTGDVKQR
jgi:hypothetical protein